MVDPQVPTGLALIYLGYLVIYMHFKFQKKIEVMKKEKVEPKPQKKTSGVGHFDDIIKEINKNLAS